MVFKPIAEKEPLKQMKLEVDELSKTGMSIAEMTRTLTPKWEKIIKTIDSWVVIFSRLSDESLAFYWDDRISFRRLVLIASCEPPNPSFRDDMINLAVLGGMSLEQIKSMREFIYKGFTPTKAADVAMGRVSDTPMTKYEAIKLANIMKQLTRGVVDVRKTWEYLETFGPIQVVSGKEIYMPLVDDCMALFSAIDNMHLWKEKLKKELPKEFFDLMSAKYGKADVKPKESIVIDVTEVEVAPVALLPTPKEG
jgi:hypothetical protein